MRKVNKDFDLRLKECLEVFRCSAADYSEGMCESFIAQNKKYGGLTPKQVEVLEEWESGPGNAAKYHEWCRSVYGDSAKLELLNMAMEYYGGDGYYYASAVRKFNSSKQEGITYVPPEHLFKRMTENKYFQTWRENATSVPKYVSGDLVEGRASTALSGFTLLITRVTNEFDTCKNGRYYYGHIVSRPIKDSASAAWTHWWESRVTSRKFRERDIKAFKRKPRKKNTN